MSESSVASISDTGTAEATAVPLMFTGQDVLFAGSGEQLSKRDKLHEEQYQTYLFQQSVTVLLITKKMVQHKLILNTH